MKKPNFFIAGAPKCGSTSLYFWLAEHPNIYMSPVKEPFHFSTDFAHDSFHDPHRYWQLFEKAGDEHIAVGEASIWYLYSKVAIPKIEATLKEPKYIILLRNPLEMAPSLHRQMLFDGDENIADFKDAWEAQFARMKGENIPYFCIEPSFLFYKEACSLGKLLQRLYKTVPETRLLPLLLDDMKENPRNVWLKIMDFLGVEDDGRESFPVKNKAQRRRFGWLKAINDLYVKVRRRYNLPPLGTGLLTLLDKKNRQPCRPKPLPSETRQLLKEAFREDIRLLESIIKRDLSHWLS